MAAPMISITGLTRRYPGVLAMDGVSLEIMAGEVIGLVGKNGAGKSTLIRMLSGLERPDEGEIVVDGTPVWPGYSPTAAHRLGLAFMHQELANVPEMSVAENIALGNPAPRRLGVFVDWQKLEQSVDRTLRDLDLAIDPRTPVANLTPVQQRMIMIARALYHDARLLVLDEPSTSLSDTEIAQLHRIVRKMRADGRTVIYISHRLREIVELTDRVVVMQDGRVTLTRHTADVDEAAIITAIAGGPGSGSARPAVPATIVDGPVVLSVLDLAATPDGPGASFEVRAGEIVGIAGLVGAGRSELVRMVCGADRAARGAVHVDGRPVSLGSPRDGVAAGIVMLPEDRRHQGLVLDMTVRENITLGSLSEHAGRPLPFIRRRSETAVARGLIDRLSIKTPGPEQAVRYLSGGNQQKVVLAKWLARDNRVFIFDEPTQGVDVHAKADMFTQIRAVVAEGKAALLISSDFSELVAICQRILVMREGEIVGVLAGDEITEPAILAMAYADPSHPSREADLSNGKDIGP